MPSQYWALSAHLRDKRGFDTNALLRRREIFRMPVENFAAATRHAFDRALARLRYSASNRLTARADAPAAVSGSPVALDVAEPQSPMATIVGAVASSHTPTIGFALDKRKQDDPVWAPIFEAYKPVQRGWPQKQPDVLLMIFNDHVTSFFFDHYSQFALGIGESYAVADEGGGPRDLPPVARPRRRSSHHIAAGRWWPTSSTCRIFQDKRARPRLLLAAVDAVAARARRGLAPIVPLQIGVLQFPIPSARRCYKLGQSLRQAIESYPGGPRRWRIVATGGLSHQVHGERCGFNNTAWDREFLELIEKDPERLANMTHGRIRHARRLGGRRGDHVAGDARRAVAPRSRSCTRATTCRR